MADLKAAAGQAARFGLAGLVSTGLGFAVIAALDAGLHVAPPLANAAGYLVGVPVGFALNRGFVFRHGGALGPTGLKYLAAVAAAFGLNQLVLRAAGAVLGPGAAPHLAAQLAGMATYTLATFLLGRYWVFRAA
ncbi:GtrA family protein [Phenylobacterium sp.]|uniref:GtrA family protein n=1 Tax=Phenylobacterium sp. TaxID=1871053 RepID=UPI003565D8AF